MQYPSLRYYISDQTEHYQCFPRLGASLGSLDVLYVGCAEGTEVWISDGRVLGTKLGTYNGRELGLLQFSSTSYWESEVAVYVLELGTNKVTKLGLKDGRVIGIKLGYMDELPICTYDGSYLWSLEFSTGGYIDGKFEGLLICA